MCHAPPNPTLSRGAVLRPRLGAMTTLEEAVHHLLTVVGAWSRVPKEEETDRQKVAYGKEIINILKELRRLTNYEDL